MRWKLIILMSILFFYGCKKNKPNEPEAEQNPIIGTWLISSTTVDGAIHNPTDLDNVMMKFIFYLNGTGQCWIKNDEFPMNITWNTISNKLNIVYENRNFQFDYKFIDNKLIVSFRENDKIVEYIYAKQ